MGKSAPRGHRDFVDPKVMRGGPLLETAAATEKHNERPGSARLMEHHFAPPRDPSIKRASGLIISITGGFNARGRHPIQC